MTIPIYIDDNILYPPFTIEKCEAFARYADSVEKRIEQHFGNRYALAYNEIIGEKEVEIINPETGEPETITIPYPVVNPNYEEEQAEARENNFKSQFFKVENFGWYRKQPKGYQSAVESMNVLFNIANVAQGIQAGLVIFYQEPDFTKPEECTEEWLVEHQIVMPAMTTQEFLQLYVAFMTAWNAEEHN